MSEQTQQVQIGQPVPDFQLPAANGEEISLSQFRGRKVVLYFYPKDSTPACTQEACDFRDLAQAYGEYGAVVLGISGDSVKSHARFAMKQGLNFPLLSDESHEVCRMFGVWQLKKCTAANTKASSVRRSSSTRRGSCSVNGAGFESKGTRNKCWRHCEKPANKIGVFARELIKTPHPNVKVG